MSKIAAVSIVAASIIGMYWMSSEFMYKSFLHDRKIDGTLSGASSVYNFQVNGEFKKKLIWNKSNTLYLDPMKMPKGDMTTPNYVLIPIDSNIGSDPFTKRFSSKVLLAANKKSFSTMNEISREAFGKSSKLTGMVVTYYIAPDGKIQEVEFTTAAESQITGQQLEALEVGIKSKLRFVTENADFKSGNYVKLSAGWNI